VILWFNNKISDIRGRVDPRFHLRNENRLDVAKYTYASYIALDPLISKYVFTLEMADGFAGRESEMQDWLEQIIPADKLILRWKQYTNLEQWRDLQKEFENIGDDIIYPAGAEDHVFLDSSIDVFKRGIDLIKQDPDPMASIMTSDFAVYIRANMRLDGQLTSCKNYLSFDMNNSDSTKVVKKEYFDSELDRVPNNDIRLIRYESWNSFAPLRRMKLYSATKEQCRHFDGYSFMHMPPEYCPPLEIPTGFFNGMTIKYGFDNYDPNCVNINPLKPAEKVVDPIQGTDYRFTLNDIPLFWRPFIKEIIIADNVDNIQMARLRDSHMLNSTRAEFNFTYLGNFVKDDYPPAHWINNHTLVEKF
jgi:hypothetical protein